MPLIGPPSQPPAIARPEPEPEPVAIAISPGTSMADKILVVTDCPKAHLRSGKFKLPPGGHSLLLLDRTRFRHVTLTNFFLKYDRVVVTLASASARGWLEHQVAYGQLESCRRQGLLILGVTREAAPSWAEIVRPSFLLRREQYDELLHSCEYQTGPLADTINAMLIRIPPPEGWWARLRRILFTKETKRAAATMANVANVAVKTVL